MKCLICWEARARVIDRMENMQTCSGGCHCGRVRYEIAIPHRIIVHRCNCSICRKAAYLHLIVPKDRFRLLNGAQDLVDYQFHTGVAHHLFCRQCGIKSYYVPRSHPESFSVNLNCVEVPPGIDVTIEDFDGSNWSKNRDNLVEDVNGGA